MSAAATLSMATLIPMMLPVMIMMMMMVMVVVVVVVLLMMMMMLKRYLDPVDRRAGHPPAENIRDRVIGFHLYHGQHPVLDSTWMKRRHRSTVILAGSVRQEASLSTEDVVVATAKVTG